MVGRTTVDGGMVGMTTVVGGMVGRTAIVEGMVGTGFRIGSFAHFKEHL